MILPLDQALTCVSNTEQEESSSYLQLGCGSEGFLVMVQPVYQQEAWQ